MLRNIKISIIIPIYNAKEHINMCLDTLLRQSLREIEIICILDCPTDGTDKIVEEYALKDSRIVVVKNVKNLHVAESRNVGLRIARGEYVGFSDHDDYRVNLHMYEKLYSRAKEDNSDIILSNAIVKEESGREIYWRFCDISKNALVSANILPMNDNVNPQKITHCIWHSIYRREFLISHSIFFKSRDMFLDEDRLFNFESYLYAKKISYVDDFFYVWKQNRDSITHTHETNNVSLEIQRTKFYMDYLIDVNKLEIFKKELWELISIEMKEGLQNYINESNETQLLLGYIMRTIKYPVIGKGYNLNFISRKRLKLMILNVIFKYNLFFLIRCCR